MLGSVFALKTARQGWVTASLDMLVRTWPNLLFFMV